MSGIIRAIAKWFWKFFFLLFVFLIYFSFIRQVTLLDLSCTALCEVTWMSLFAKNCFFKGTTGKAQQLGHRSPFLSTLRSLAHCHHIPGRLWLSQDPWSMVDYPGSLMAPLPHPCFRPPLPFWLFYYSFATITQGPMKGNKRQGNTNDSTLLPVGAYKMLK